LNTNWTIWFTGLSGSGKSTLSTALAKFLKELSLPHEVLDGDEVRRELCSDLGFSKKDRDENIRRIGYVCQLLNRHNVIAIVAAISPYREARDSVRTKCANFIEVHVDCSLQELVKRDVKGLYHRALAGELASFSGISDPYEAPLRPDIYVNSERESAEESLAVLLSKLEELHCLPGAQDPGCVAMMHQCQTSEASAAKLQAGNEKFLDC
jgi:adenylyl-sulfate kinase